MRIKLSITLLALPLLFLGTHTAFGATLDNQNNEYDIFLTKINPQELVVLDAYYDQFMNSKPNLSQHQLVEVLQSNMYRFESPHFEDKYHEGVRTGLLRSYAYLKEAYEARLESIGQIENPLAMASAVSRANAKRSMIAPNILKTLLCYEKTGAIEDYNNAPDLKALINKYRGICKLYGELTE